MDRRAKETVRARWTLIWFLVGLTLLIAAMEEARAAEVYYNPEGAPIQISVADMEQAIGHAVWELETRLGLDLEYAGLTGETFEDGKIIVQWENLLFTDSALSLESEDLYHADLAGGTYRVGYASWAAPDGVLTKAKVVLNTYNVKKVDTCLRETIAHEIAHPLAVVPAHTDDPEDVMYPYRNACRYSFSLSDLDFIGGGKPVTSCHAEFTPDGDLEYLDHKGQRIALVRHSATEWEVGSVYPNPAPQACDGAKMEDGEVIITARSYFLARPFLLRLRQEGKLFRMVSVTDL